ncbi:MAG: hypothetical protein JNL98_35145, partial [Bryobacterales bacterium]|nr:hypothetical protein [Bryobacterales bacterium]
FEVVGLSALARLEDGTVAVSAGNGANFRSVYPVTPAGLGQPLNAPRMLPLQSVTRWREKPYFTAATRLFRGETGRIEWFEPPPAPPGVNFVPDFVMATPDALLVHQTDGGFYRVDNVEACKWTSQPLIAAEGVVNAASGEFADTISPRTLITVYGSGLGPIAPRGSILDGALRATGQAAPYPALVLGNFSGAIPGATLSGTTLPVVASDSTQTTVQATTASTGTLLLYYTWQGLQLIYPTPLRGTVATPGLFTVDNVKDGTAAAINEDGTRHSEMNPAERGTLLDLYGTGFGAFTSNLTTGEFFSKTAQVALVNPVTVTIGGEVATVEFAGGAPGMIAGTTLLRVRVPEDLPAGAHKVAVAVEGQTVEPTQRVTVYVRE